MQNKQNNLNPRRLSPEVARQLHELCAKLLDQVILNDEIAELNRLLDNDPAARQFYLRYVLLNSMLLGSVGKQQRVEAEWLGAHTDSFGAHDFIDPGSQRAIFEVDTDLRDRGTSRFTLVALATLAIAATLLIAATVTLWLALNLNDPLFVKSDGFSNSRQTESIVDEKHSLTTRVSYVSQAARWKQPNDAPSSGSFVSVGTTLELSEGEIELTYRCGTKLLLMGPAVFQVEDSGGRLRRGGLVVSVTEAGHGFSIVTPNGKVVDLGTEFGVAVDDFGVSEVSVFEGKVETFPLTGPSNGRKIELLKGESLQWNRDKMIPLDADLRKFAASVLGRQLAVDRSDERISCVDRFRAGVLDSSKWKTLGAVIASPEGLSLKGEGISGDRPFLISAEQFNPSRGTVSVICDLRFGAINAGDSPRFSIMTRGADERGIALDPWSGSLASCVRCSFGSDDGDSREGMLQTGVKFESDREMTSASWSGFLPPQPDTRYRVVMRDDGVNVSFTVSLLEKPSISKTVTCRSLFRGKTNYVALGGSISGSTIVERVEITQDRSSATISSYAEFCSLLLADPAKRELERQLLEDLVPENAELVLQDDFASAQLDSQKWKSLGEIVMQGDLAQLGKPNSVEHIDTWKARPYLLTRKPLDPSKGTLTIIGKISFADNFLAGYGGSFAVMTRADDQIGSGPGWEYSVLQRGIRANFWPAALDEEHILEIHEKPATNTITLLAKNRAQVDPITRLYLFRVVDDGETVTLTIIDPEKPETEMSISSPTTSELKQGFVGFESCWGSPNSLDDIRIYQAKRPAQLESKTGGDQ